MTMSKFGVILLAAGKSTRFGDNKLLSIIRDKSMIDHSIEKYQSMSSLIGPIIVVIGGFREQMQRHLENRQLVITYNSKFETGGMISSIQAGLEELQKLEHKLDGIFIHPADVPFVNIDDIQNMIDMMSSEKHGIVVPYYKKQRGHPVLVNCRLIRELENLEEENQGLRGFLNKYKDQVGYMVTENSGVRRDIDYKSDLLDNEY